MKRAVLVPVVAGAVMLACTSDRPLPPTSPHISAAIADGAHGGNPSFFFLPPMVSSPTTTGVFNPILAPVVTICQVVNDACVAGTTFSPGAVTLDLANQQYQVNWATDPTTVNLSATYRITVLVNAQELGFADVQPVSNGSQLKKLDTGELIGLVDGRTLPIKFRIELGALCVDQFGFPLPDCTEVTVGAAAQDVITTSGRAAIHFDAGSFSQPVDLVIAQVVTGGDLGVTCHITNLAQFDDCYSITISPSTVPLNVAARAEICLTLLNTAPPAVAKDLLLGKSEPGVPGVLVLHGAPSTLITCPPYTTPPSLGARARRGPWDIASAGWRLVRGLVEPKPLHAATTTSLVIDEGLGGTVPSGSPAFSHFGWVTPESLSISSLNPQTAPAGATLAGNTVCLATTHPTTLPVSGALVTFTVTAGGGQVVPRVGPAAGSTSVTTDDGGCAAVAWQLGASPGTNTLTASATSVDGTVQFTATGTPTTIGATGNGRIGGLTGAAFLLATRTPLFTGRHD
jgi:hypothetical protein